MKKAIESLKKLFSAKLSLGFVLVLVTIGMFLSYFFLSEKAASGSNSEKQQIVSRDCPSPPKKRYRIKGYRFTNPILLTDILEQSKELDELKQKLNYVIQQNISAGQISSASIYVRSLESGEWISINQDEMYNPASLIKVPTLITYLIQASKEPGLLDRQIVFSKKSGVPNQTFNSESIQVGKKYTVRELLTYMIVHSDNNATKLLNESLDVSAFRKLFTDLGLPDPNVHDAKFQINCFDYSKFFRLLYNATYITNDHAEFALNLLSQVKFTEGFLKQMPEGMSVAHKFGEAVLPGDMSVKQLHESGIFYLEGHPYLLTMMTKGPSVKALPAVLSEISKATFEYFKNNQATS